MNKLEAKITKIQNHDSLNLVSFEFEQQTLTMISLELNETIKKNKKVILSIKSTNITLAKNLDGLISFSNKLLGKIKHIEKGELLSNIVSDINGTLIEAVITTNCFNEMNLALNDQILILFKESDLAIMEVKND